MSTTNAPKAKREYYAMVLLRRFAEETMPQWAKQGIDIKSVDACGGFEDGKRLLRNAGFVSLGYKGDKGTREIYTLDLDQSELKPLQTYKDALANYKQ
jgi:hypothetical protein